MLTEKESGFTLIEILVVIGIMGILAAIAIPQYANYRAKAFDAAALSDFHNLLEAEQHAFLNDGVYIDCTNKSVPSFSSSENVTVKCFRSSKDTSLLVFSYHINGNYVYSANLKEGNIEMFSPQHR